MKAQTINSYIKEFPADVQKVLKQVRAAVRKAAPKATEAVKYGIPTLVYNGNLIHYGAFKKHVSMFPMTAAVRKALGTELSKYKMTTGGVQFPYGTKLPLGLIAKIVKVRLKEGAATYKKK